jgi:hypothetical protein
MAQRKKTNPAVLNARRRWKNDMTKQRKYADEHAAAVARQQLMYRDNKGPGNDIQNAIVYATAQLGRAVVDSMDIKMPINISFSHRTQAYTDWKSIVIKIQKKIYDPDDLPQIKNLISFVKGLIYHEVGHLRYTVPLKKLMEDVNVDYTTLPSQDFEWIRRAWNAMEDQRMECAMVRESAIMRNYFAVIVTDFVIMSSEISWPLVAGRTYLPKKLLDSIRMYAQETTGNSDPSLISDTSAVIAKYKRADNPQDMYAQVLAFVDILKRWGKLGVTGSDPRGDHVEQPEGIPDNDPTNEGADVDYRQKYQKAANTSDEEEAEAEAEDGEQGEQGEQPANPANGTDDESNDGNGNDGDEDDSDSEIVRTNEDRGLVNKNNDAEQDDKTSRGSSHSNETPAPVPKPTYEDLIKSLKDASKEIIKDALSGNEQTVKDFISTVNDELRRDMPHNIETAPLEHDDLVVADEVHRGIMQALETLAVQNEPTWQFRQEQGILDPSAYSLREPGDTDYWIGKDGDGSKGFDLAVSIMLDTSASMLLHWCVYNGISAYAIRKACDELNIPCTVTTFSDDGRALWRSDEPITEVYPYPTAGTHPLDNFEALDDERMGKGRHLVVVLTDGQWSGIHSVAQYYAPGRYFLLVSLGNGLRQYLEALNPHSVVEISSPKHLPEHVTRALAGFLA